MKTLRITAFTAILMAITSISFSQSLTETIKVSGNCGMCKKKIETAAKTAGASYALWNKDTKELTVKYNKATTNTAKIEKKIAGAGYDTPDYKATEEAYNNLDACCQYDREEVKKDAMNCSDKCEMKDGKCKDEAACKEKGCCKDSEACKAMGCSGHEANMAKNAKMECSGMAANGKSTMNCNKDGKSCCSKKTTTGQ